MNLTLEQQLLSARFRVALHEAVVGDEPSDPDLDGVVSQLAGGNLAEGVAALQQLLDDCHQQREIAQTMLSMFLDGHLDVVGVRDAQLTWVSTELGLEALN